ncbi:uncharacterized protein LOC123864845 [Maniola jurtina]|uniref:uncharacterized protein LOC123864845 n=1 Tax=Maniola jurtina TaxID=191418 RepID=UPI001E6873FA|nr:uncharacterized protein LOC123864845 [Maniola jurtina]
MRCLVVLACVCAVAYARAQSSVDTSELKTNAEIPEQQPIEEPITSDIPSSFNPNQDSEAGDANTNNNENESNISSNDEELDVAPTNLAPSVIVPSPDESDNYANDGDLDVAPTNLAPIIVAEPDESDNIVDDEDLEVAPTNLAPSVSDRQGRYKSLPDQYDEESAPRTVGKLSCKEKNERYSVPGSCDRYVECLNGTAEEKQCPDGLRYNPDVLFNVYPCQYPIDVPCLARSALQPAQPTADCPHQFGYFKTGDSRNCSGFRNCVNGVGYEFTCPEGLAFSSDNYRCEWPDQVSDCDAEAFLGFRCPEVPASKELGPPAGFRFYRSPSDCQVYFICIEGKPRRLGCGGYSAFDELTETCVNAEEVSVCPQELKTRAAQAKEKEERRQRLLAENPFKSGLARYTAEELPTNVPTYAEPEPESRDLDLDDERDVESVTPTQFGVTPTQFSELDE